ncbi:unnamed protein product [Enterobius vermicularis]|uniref:RING-type domain-containing protein n=1 Tax=Enterobius vermicularis TaxID=51028 RepID=A0A0N4V5H0_ENTVE|nr:unnamed protein product [Enterobius vermicularis]
MKGRKRHCLSKQKYSKNSESSMMVVFSVVVVVAFVDGNKIRKNAWIFNIILNATIAVFFHRQLTPSSSSKAQQNVESGYRPVISGCYAVARNVQPKLLPCHHTFCLPCLESCADVVHRILKCPECRAEHPLPYDGVKCFQSNYTLMGFLDVHLQATDDNAAQLEAYIQRCSKSYCPKTALLQKLLFAFVVY